MRIVDYATRHFQGVDWLWLACLPTDAARTRAASAIPAKMAMEDGLFFIAEDDKGQVVGSVMASYDGHRGWLYAQAVGPRSHEQGVGTALVEHACEALALRGCTKVNLQVRADNEPAAQPDERLGFVREPRVSIGRELRTAERPKSQ